MVKRTRTIGMGILGMLLMGSAGLYANVYEVPAAKRIDTVLDSGWKFILSDQDGAQSVKWKETGWSNVSIPHTWNNLDGQDGGGNYYRGAGWYRKHFTLDKRASGKNVYIRFEAANEVADVYVNGTLAGKHIGGYSAFCFDITSLVKAGEDNILAVRVDNSHSEAIPPQSADYTFFGGIYRPVHLIILDKLCVTPLDYASPGVYLKQENVNNSSADLQILCKIKNNDSSPKNVTVRSIIVDAAGNEVSVLKSSLTVNAQSGTDVVQKTSISNPHLWSGVNDPYLYHVYTEVWDGDVLSDWIKEPLGFRKFHIDANSGFFLNDARYPLHGVSRHQDRLNKGWAISDKEHLEDMKLIMEMGCTGIRLAHYQHSETFYSLCDQNGLAAWAEIPLVNTVSEDPAFAGNTKEMMVELIRQNYNHPSIFCWGIGNEIGGYPSPDDLLDELNALCHKEDPARYTVYASNDGHGGPVNWHSDLNGWNKYNGWYGGDYSQFSGWADQAHADYPDKKIAVSEYGAGASPFYHTDKPQNQDHSEEYQCLFHEAYWLAMKDRPYLWGTFIWNMFDFAADIRNEGDTPGRNDKGLVTYDRKIKKDVFYWYKANWTKEPFVYITGRRFTPRQYPNTNVSIKVYGNVDSVELKLNGISQGTVKADGSCKFEWPDRVLTSGKNVVEAIGTKGGSIVTDTVTWIMNPPVLKKVPGLIRAEFYDNQEGLALQGTADVGGGRNVGWTDGGDWLDYQVSIAKAGMYTVDYRTAAETACGEIEFQLDGNPVITTELPITMGWQVWTNTQALVKLPAGKHTIRLYVKKPGFNLNWFKLTYGALANKSGQ